MLNIIEKQTCRYGFHGNNKSQWGLVMRLERQQFCFYFFLTRPMKVIQAECQLRITMQGLRLKCERFVMSKEFEHPLHYSGGSRINDESISIFNQWCGMEPWRGE